MTTSSRPARTHRSLELLERIRIAVRRSRRRADLADARIDSSEAALKQKK